MMKTFNYHYNFAFNGSACDQHLDERLVNISSKATVLPIYFHMDGLYPSECAIPVYGFIVPPLAIIVVLVNIIIIVIFAKPHIRSHTTVILTIIAISDSLNISLPSIIYVYFYMLGNHEEYVPYKMCFLTYLLIHLLPETFNLISIWSTILLACIRFRCLQSPFRAKDLHSSRRIALGIIFAIILAVFIQLPSVALFDFIPVDVPSLTRNQTMETCIITSSKILEGACKFRQIHIWIKLFGNSFIPCISLLVLDSALLYTLRKAEIRRSSLRCGRCGSSFKFGTHGKHCGKSQNSSTLVTEGCQKTEKHNLNNTEQTRSNAITDMKGRKLFKNGENNDLFKKGINNEPKDNEIDNSFDENVTVDPDYEYKCISNKSLHDKSRKALSRVLNCSGSVTKLFHRNDQVDAKPFKTSSTRSNDSYKRLAKESKRTSWMIFAVVALICSHELMYGIVFAHKMVNHKGPLPINFFGCGTVYLYLWQYITYPLIFLIYCFMSAAFRIELRKTMTCSKAKTAERRIHGRNSVFMSPCTLRRSIHLNHERKGCSEKLIEKSY